LGGGGRLGGSRTEKSQGGVCPREIAGCPRWVGSGPGGGQKNPTGEEGGRNNLLKNYLIFF